MKPINFSGALSQTPQLLKNNLLVFRFSSGTVVFDTLQLRAEASRKYPTLLTTSFFATNYAELYFELFRAFDWSTLYFITDTSAPGVYSFISNKVSSSSRNRLNATVYITTYRSAVAPLNFDSELKKVRDASRGDCLTL